MFFLEIRDSKACGLELWANIDGYPNYQVSTYGRVRSLNYHQTGETKVLKAKKNNDGYLYISLCKDGKVKQFLVHRLVAGAFLFCKDRENLEINHKTEKKDENRVECIEWCEHKYNMNFGTRTQRVAEKKRGVYNTKKSKQVKQMTLTGELVRTYPSTMEAERNGFNHRHVANCCNGRLKSHKGFKWAYA